MAEQMGVTSRKLTYGSVRSIWAEEEGLNLAKRSEADLR